MNLSDFGFFWQQLMDNPLLLLAVIMTMGVILVNGWTDAPNAIATCVVTRCMSPRLAILMAAVCNFLGVFVMSMLNATVAETITKMVDFGDNTHEAIIALSAALFAIVVWATAAWIFGIPTSESHALIAGLTGSAIAMHGAQDGQKFMGVILMAVMLANGQTTGEAVAMPVWLMLVCSIVMGVGTSLGGKKIIKSVGMDMVKLEKHQGFSADIASAISLLLSSVFGIPVSTTHVLTVISWREIYDKLEKCADACEHVGDCVETIVMKNT